MTDINKTLVERGNRYGEFKDNSILSQALEDSIRSTKGYEILNSLHREAIKFIFQKISRIVNGDPNYIDNWHDIAGYATLVEKELGKLPQQSIATGEPSTLWDATKVIGEAEKAVTRNATSNLHNLTKSQDLYTNNTNPDLSGIGDANAGKHVYTVLRKLDGVPLKVYRYPNALLPDMYYIAVPTTRVSDNQEFIWNASFRKYPVTEGSTKFRSPEIIIQAEELYIWTSAFPENLFERLIKEAAARETMSGSISIKQDDFKAATGISI